MTTGCGRKERTRMTQLSPEMRFVLCCVFKEGMMVRDALVVGDVVVIVAVVV